MRIGVLGGGQLGRMLALAGYPLGLEFVFYDHNPQACAASVGTMVVGEFDDKVKLAEFANQVDIVTVEFENIPLETLEHVAQYVPVYPGPRAVSAAQDRLDEKQLFRSLGIRTPEFYAVDSAAFWLRRQRANNTRLKRRRCQSMDGIGRRTSDC
jgi:5-(carboxyamino)imidazole ribonucleotide synthase